MKALRIAVTAALVLTAGAAFARQDWTFDPNAPLDIQASRQGAANTANCTVRLEGNVRLTQGRVRLLGDTLLGRAPKRGDSCGDMNRMEITGRVFLVTPTETVRADRADYNRDSDVVIFTGDVVLTRGQDVSTSTRLEFNLKTKETTMNGPVRMVLFPEKRDAPAK